MTAVPLILCLDWDCHQNWKGNISSIFDCNFVKYLKFQCSCHILHPDSSRLIELLVQGSECSSKKSKWQWLVTSDLQSSSLLMRNVYSNENWSWLNVKNHFQSHHKWHFLRVADIMMILAVNTSGLCEKSTCLHFKLTIIRSSKEAVLISTHYQLSGSIIGSVRSSRSRNVCLTFHHFS